MIAVALSGGVDSAAAALVLHARGEHLMGVTMLLGDDLPDGEHIARASDLCARLGMAYHLIDLQEEFNAVRRYFCDAYRGSLTPNPCAVCNRDMKFGLLWDKARALGASALATGHYVRKGSAGGRFFLMPAAWKNSQEYFLGLVPQEALAQAVFPLGEMTKPAAAGLVAAFGLEIPPQSSSQDVCFIRGDYAAFIRSYAGYQPMPGPILDVHGRTVGTHRGAIHYTIGQRKGLGMGFGKRVYVLAVDRQRNTVTIGDPSAWPHRGFLLMNVNYQKISGLDAPRTALAKVRYKQAPRPVTLSDTPQGLWVDYPEPFAPGQLAVMYEPDGAILCAGIISIPARSGEGQGPC